MPLKLDRSSLELKWPEDRDRIKVLERLLRKKIRLTPLKKAPGLIAGADAAFSGEHIIAAACLFKYPEMTLLDEKHVIRKVAFPYIPGYLSFREGPSVIEAIEGLRRRPDVVLFDGQGIAHPRRLGIATVAGAVLSIPSIGCAKSRLIGEYREPGKMKGSVSLLRQGQEVIGGVLRTRDGVRPIFVSPGNLIDLKGSISIALASSVKHRLPEPLRCADILSKRVKRSLGRASSYQEAQGRVSR